MVGVGVPSVEFLDAEGCSACFGHDNNIMKWEEYKGMVWFGRWWWEWAGILMCSITTIIITNSYIHSSHDLKTIIFLTPSQIQKRLQPRTTPTTIHPPTPTL